MKTNSEQLNGIPRQNSKMLYDKGQGIPAWLSINVLRMPSATEPGVVVAATPTQVSFDSSTPQIMQEKPRIRMCIRGVWRLPF